MMNNEVTYPLEVVSVRLVKEAPLLSNKPVNNPKAAVELLGKYLCDMDREMLCVINLKSNGVPINCNFVSIGALDKTLACPREVVKTSILSNAANIIILHNHPSGNVLPSREDLQITDRMYEVGELIGIPLIDHVIVGGIEGRYFSFKEENMIPYPEVQLETKAR